MILGEDKTLGGSRGDLPSIILISVGIPFIIILVNKRSTLGALICEMLSHKSVIACLTKDISIITKRVANHYIVEVGMHLSEFVSINVLCTI